VLRRGLALSLLVWTAAWPAAAAAPASGAATVAFGVTVQGSQRTVVTGTRTTVDDLGCSVTRRDLEQQTLTFASVAPSRIVAVQGRAASTRVAVGVEARGTKRRTRTFAGTAPECDLAPLTTESSCGPARLAGRAAVALPTFGSVRLSGSLARPGDTFRCAPTVARPRRFLVASEGQFPAKLITDPSAARVVLRGDARFTDTFDSGARRVTTVRWTIVLRRLTQ
jgi:hypothetical protein